jgi:hypothetical protein
MNLFRFEIVSFVTNLLLYHLLFQSFIFLAVSLPSNLSKTVARYGSFSSTGVAQICSPTKATKISSNEYESLQSLFNSTNGGNWTWIPIYNINGIPWDFNDGSDPCVDSWQGVSCLYLSTIVDSQVVCVGYMEVLSLEVHNLFGQIPSTCLGNFSYMVELLLYDNFLYGPIPSDIGLLQSLVFMELAR